MKISKVMCNLYPQATDRDFVDKLNSKFKTAPNFEVVRNHTPLFTIVHYAGKVRSHNTRIIITDEFICVPPVWRAFLCCVQVQYNASGFLEKNRDTIPANIRELFINSVTPLLSVLFAGLSLSLSIWALQSDPTSVNIWYQKRVWSNRSIMSKHLHTVWDEIQSLWDVYYDIKMKAMLVSQICLCVSATISRTGTLMPRKAKV